MMKAIIAITLTFLLTLTVLISGASGYSDCAVKCMRAQSKAHPHAAMGSTNLRVPDCCAGGMPSTCEMNSAPRVKIPECSITSGPTVSPEWLHIGLIADDADADLIRLTQVNLRFTAGQLNKTPPIYLLTLSILC
jgi:hypothetical protein